MKYRSRADITNMILESVRAGATKTKIMYQAYLSYSQVAEYLQFLQQNGLIRHDEESQVYRITDKGFRFLNISNELNDMISLSNSKYSLNKWQE
ncbi:MAG TPA: winged helix-turn-helix domain-containing protein [Candidatus Nitrosotalea sp.]|nr:winged helix-turn-helix domain-containing protein [Candidatus Nitrosotalea sp.]